MFINYLLLAWRNLFKNPVAAFVNIITLALGLSAATITVMLFYYHMGFERHYSDSEQIYQVRTLNRSLDSSEYENQDIWRPVAEQLLLGQKDLTATILSWRSIDKSSRYKPKIEFNGIELSSESYIATDESFWQIFDLRFLAGDPHTALSEPNSVVVTEFAAKRFFGDTPAMGQIIEAGEYLVTVVGVVEDIPRQSHLHSSLRVYSNSFAGLFVSPDLSFQPTSMIQIAGPEGPIDQALLEQVSLYLKSPKPSRLQAFEERANLLGSGGKLNYPYQQINQPKYLLAPLHGLHLRDGGTSKSFELNFNSWKFLYILLTAASAILIVACLNSTMISTALYNKRTREVGMRKVLGANGPNISRQFFTESLLLNVLAALLAAVMISVALPWIDRTAVSGLAEVDFLTPAFLLSLVALLLVVSLFSAWYPMRQLSRVSPMNVFHRSPGSGAGRWLIKGITVIQFACSAALFAIFAVMLLQVKHISAVEMGLNYHNMFLVGAPLPYGKQTPFREKLVSHPDVISVSTGVYGASPQPGYEVHLPEGKQLDSTLFAQVQVRPGVLQHYQMKLLAGRDFSSAIYQVNFDNYQETREWLNNPDATREVIVTLQGLDRLGLKNPDDALGTEVIQRGIRWQVVGVVDAFPTITGDYRRDPGGDFLVPDSMSRGVFVRHREGALDRVKKHIRQVGLEFELDAEQITFQSIYSFKLRRLSENLAKPLKQLGPLAICALLISLLGLYAMTLFMTRLRVREVGIRKVMGSSARQVAALMVGDGCKPLAIALLFGLPVAYLASQQFLQGFVERISLWQVVFVLVPVVMVVIAIAVTALQVMSTAKCDPAKVLRCE